MQISFSYEKIAYSSISNQVTFHVFFSISRYMSPEYAMHGHISVKTDIYSLGVLLLEIISGKRNTSFYASNYVENLITYVSMFTM